MDLIIISNKMLRLPCECYECLRMLTNGIANFTKYVWMMRMSYQRGHCLCNFLQMMWLFDDEAAIDINTVWIWRWAHCKTFARNEKRWTLQTPCKCFTNVANASEYLTNVTNGLRMLKKIDGKWQHSQHSLKFRRRFLNWSIFVSRFRICYQCLQILGECREFWEDV